MSLVEKLHSKRIKTEEIIGWGTYLRKQWEDAFASSLTETNKKKIYLCDYLWHVFSYEKIDCSKNEKAEELFNAQKKKSCYIFFQHSNNVLLVDRASNLSSFDFAHEEDVYVVDKNFSWTYVKTHELDCGPYFTHVVDEK